MAITAHTKARSENFKLKLNSLFAHTECIVRGREKVIETRKREEETNGDRE